MCRGCWFLPSLAPLCVLDNEAQSSVTRIRGSPLNWGNQEEVFREVFRPTPFHSPPVQSGRQGWKRRGLCWAVPPLSPGPRFPQCDKRAEGRARGGARRTADKGDGGVPPREGNGFLRGRPTQGIPARQPGTHRAGSRSPGPSPCPTGCAAGRGQRGGSRAGRCGTHVRGNSAGGLGSEPSAVETRMDCGGRRPKVGPDIAPPPGSTNPRLSPPPPGIAEGGRTGDWEARLTLAAGG